MHYDRSPHCRTVRQTDFSSFIFSELYLFCGVGRIHLDMLIIAYLTWYGNGMFLQFYAPVFGYFVVFNCENVPCLSAGDIAVTVPENRFP